MIDEKNKMLPATTTAWQKTGGWAGGQMVRIYSQLGCSGDKIPSDLEGVFVIDGWRIHVVAASKKKSLTRVYVELPRGGRLVPAGRMRQVKIAEEEREPLCKHCRERLEASDRDVAMTPQWFDAHDTCARADAAKHVCSGCGHVGPGLCEACCDSDMSEEERADKRWLGGNAEAFKAMCAKEVTIHTTKRYRFNEATQAFDEIEEASVADFLQGHPVGTVRREYAAAPGAGFTDYRVTRYTADTVYGVQIRSTVREMTAEETR